MMNVLWLVEEETRETTKWEEGPAKHQDGVRTKEGRKKKVWKQRGWKKEGWRKGVPSCSGGLMPRW